MPPKLRLMSTETAAFGSHSAYSDGSRVHLQLCKVADMSTDPEQTYGVAYAHVTMDAKFTPLTALEKLKNRFEPIYCLPVTTDPLEGMTSPAALASHEDACIRNACHMPQVPTLLLRRSCWSTIMADTMGTSR